MEPGERPIAISRDEGLLNSLFSQFPSLKQAKVASVRYRPASDSLEMLIDLREEPEEPSSDVFAARIRLRWARVASFRWPLGEEELLAISFRMREDLIETTLETFPGIFATVISSTVEAHLLAEEPSLDPAGAWMECGSGF